jgi:molybdopterin converting factor small subunit
MTIKVLFFGLTADFAGRRELSLDMPDGSTVQSAVNRITELYPPLGGHRLLFALNQEYVRGNVQTQDRDELAVFTAVSGG